MSDVETKVSDEPSIDWESALDQFVSVQAEETIDLSDQFDGQEAELEQFLGRDSDLKYFLLARRTTPEEQSITRTFIPTPLRCRISQGTNASVHRLEIMPNDTSSVVHEETSANGDQWTTSITKGSPEVVIVESLDLDELQQARIELVGPETAKREAELEAAALAAAAGGVAGGVAECIESTDDDDIFDEPAASLESDVEEVDEIEDLDAVEFIDSEAGDETAAVDEDEVEFVDDDVEEVDEIEDLDDVDFFEEDDDEPDVIDDDELVEDDFEEVDEDPIEIVDEVQEVEEVDELAEVDEVATDEEYEYDYEYEEVEEAEEESAPAFDFVDEDTEDMVDDVEPGAFDFIADDE